MKRKTDFWVFRNEVPIDGLHPVRPLTIEAELVQTGEDAYTASDVFADIGIDPYIPHSIASLNSIFYLQESFEVFCTDTDLVELARDNAAVQIIAYGWKTTKQLLFGGEPAEKLVLLVEPVVDRVQFQWNVDDDLSWAAIILNGRTNQSPHAIWRYSDCDFKDWVKRITSLSAREWTQLIGYQSDSSQMKILTAFWRMVEEMKHLSE